MTNHKQTSDFTKSMNMGCGGCIGIALGVCVLVFGSIVAIIFLIAVVTT